MGHNYDLYTMSMSQEIWGEVTNNKVSNFFCSECGETLMFGYDANQNAILLNILETEFDRGLKVVNLHPELTIDKSSKDNPTYFPSIEFLKR